MSSWDEAILRRERSGYVFETHSERYNGSSSSPVKCHTTDLEWGADAREDTVS